MTAHIYWRPKRVELMRVSASLKPHGFTESECDTLLRVSKKLQRWFEHECNGEIERDAGGRPWRSDPSRGKHRVAPLFDAEARERQRLKGVMQSHPDCIAYVQGDPRGAVLWIIPKVRLPGADWNVDTISSVYPQAGIPVG